MGDDSKKSIKMKNYGEVGIISRWWLLYFNPLLSEGAKRPIMKEDLGNLYKSDVANVNYHAFEETWDQELLKPKENRSIFKALMAVTGIWVWIYALFLYFIGAALQFVSPLILDVLVSNASETDDSKKLPELTLWAYAAILFISPIIGSLCISRQTNIVTQNGLKLKTAISAAIFRKSIRLSPYEQNSFGSGKIVTYMSNDAEQVYQFVQFLTLVVFAPFQIVTALILIYGQVQNSTWVGIGFMVALMPVTGAVFGAIGKSRKDILKFTDKRVTLMNEIIVGIRVIKFYAWERAFLGKVNEIRAKELAALKRLAYVAAVGFGMVLLSVPIIQPVLIFISYVSWGNVITAAKAFTTISLFQIMRFPFAFLPLGFVSLIQARIAMNRILGLLESDEIDEGAVDTSGENLPSDVAAVIENGSFSWSGPKPTNAEIQEAQEKYDTDLKAAKAKRDKKTKKNANKGGANVEEGDATVVAAVYRDGGDDNESSENEEDLNVSVPRALGWEGMHLSDINVSFPKGKLTAIVGRVGSGKSSMLSALLGELPVIEGSVKRKGIVSYAAQQPWILNETVQSNIIFGNEFDENHYKRVLKVCALESDLKVLKAGDMTEIGERGINVSGGQKARISLARATYNKADIYIMDDVLSAVDSHVGKQIFDECLIGELDGQTRIFVTNSTQFLPQCDYVIVMKSGGIFAQGSYESLAAEGVDMGLILDGDSEDSIASLTVNDDNADSDDGSGTISRSDSRSGLRGRGVSSNNIISRSASKDGRSMTKEKSMDDALRQKQGVLVEEETREVGNVSLADYAYYARAGTKVVIVLILLCFTLSRLFELLGPFWLSFWANAYSSTANSSDVDVMYYLTIYGILGLLGVTFMTLRGVFVAMFRVKAASSLHEKLIFSVIRAPTRFFDVTPIGRILNRFSKDIDRVDLQLPDSLSQLAGCFFNVFGALIGIVASTSALFILPLLVLGYVYFRVERYFRKTSTEIQRIESIAGSPIFADFSQALAGTSTIRAFNTASRFIKQNEHDFDSKNIATLLQNYAFQWLSIRLDIIGASITFCVAGFSAYSAGVVNPGLLGIALSFSFEMTAFLKHAVRMSAATEAQMNSVERIREYSNLEQEPEWIIESNRPAQDWPQKGAIQAQDMSFAYTKGGKNVLKHINFNINSKEKIGIVGRTGAGKSSLMVALFRMSELSGGNILIDGVDVSTIGVEDLRRRLGIIPQDPVLFSASVRYNLDPFNQSTDSEVWSALEKVQLKDAISRLPNGLSEEVSEGGSNFSVGERQLICIARALLRSPKVLVLDEATASVDNDTDKLIQQMIRKNFKDCTILTIAHRLHTILDSDRIMVFDDGNLAEFDSPHVLFEKTDAGIFRGMCEAAGIHDLDEALVELLASDEEINTNIEDVASENAVNVDV